MAMTLTKWFVSITIDINGCNTAHLVAHIIERGGHGTFSDRFGVAADQTDQDGVSVGDTVDASEQNVTNPRADSGRDCDKSNKER